MLVIVGSLGARGSATPLPPSHGPVTAEAGEMPAARAGPFGNCSGTILTRLAVTPMAVEVVGLHTQEFVATAVSSCGANLTPITTVSWALSSGALGTLSSNAGASTTYTACLAPMSGLLHVTGSFQGVTLRVNVSIAVSYASAGGSSSPGAPNASPATPGVPLGGGGWAGWSVAALLVALGTTLAVRTRRRQRASRAGASAHEGTPDDAAAHSR